MSSVSKEVGNKIYKASEMDDSLFHYSYGFSLISLKMSFFCTEIAALFSTVVYMSKRDERTYNRYQMSTMLKNIRGGNQADENLLHDRYYQHGRFSCLQRASRSASMDEPLNSTNPTPRKSLYLMPSELVEEPSVDESAVNDEYNCNSGIKASWKVDLCLYRQNWKSKLSAFCMAEVFFSKLIITDGFPSFVNIAIPLVSIGYIELSLNENHGEAKKLLPESWIFEES
uniref:Uncharacterized protein n=1 Tax=Ditylenchus dipsaci TaxID=166011 RepID=A0A915EJV5_9BILA